MSGGIIPVLAAGWIVAFIFAMDRTLGSWLIIVLVLGALFVQEKKKKALANPQIELV